MESINKEKDTKKKRLIAIIIAAFLICAGVTGFFIFQSRYTALSIRLQRLVGVVNLYDKNGSERSLVEKMRLNSGNKLTTATESLVTVALDNTKLLTMEEASKAQVNKRGKKLKFDLLEGNLFFNVTEKLGKKESFEIKTSTMAVGIRGTSAYVGMDFSHHETVMVTDGTVHVVAENPRTHEKIEVDVPAGMKIVIFLDDEAEGDATISFTMEPFIEEDLPAMALDTIHKNKKLRERVIKATGFNTDKLESLYELNTVEGESMVGEAKAELTELGLDDAIPFMGDKVEYMVEAANDAVVIAGEDLPLEVQIIKGLEGTSDAAAEGGLEKDEVVSVIHTTSGVIGDLIVKAQENDLDDETILMVADNVSGAVTVAVKDMIVGDLTLEEITGVVDTIGTVFKYAIEDGVGEDSKAIVSNVEETFKFVKDTVNDEMNKNANGEETSEALLRRKTVSVETVVKADEKASDENNTSSITNTANTSNVSNTTDTVNNTSATDETSQSSDNNAQTDKDNISDNTSGTSATSSSVTPNSSSADSSSKGNSAESPTNRVYTVRLEKDGGVINGADVTSYTYGTAVNLPNDVSKAEDSMYSYSFKGWSVNSTSFSQIRTIPATETGDKTYYAFYEKTAKSYGVNISGLENISGGSVSVKNSNNIELTNGASVKTADYNTRVTIKATPDTGYGLGTFRVTAKGSSSGSSLPVDGTGDTRTFTMPAEAVNVSVTAIFKKSVTGVKLNAGKKNINPGDTFDLIATISPSDAFDKSVEWSTGDDSVATVTAVPSQNGEIIARVTGVASGTTTVTVTTVDGRKTATCNVKVLDASAPTIDKSKLRVGELGLPTNSNEAVTAASFQRAATLTDIYTKREIQEGSSGSKIYAWMDNSNNVYWYSDAEYVYLPEDCSALFYDYKNAYTTGNAIITIDLTGLNTHKVTNMQAMFASCRQITTLNIGEWDTSNVTNMGALFYDCMALNDVDVSGWDMSNVTNIQMMFYNCDSMTDIDLSRFTISNAGSLYQMFYHCDNLQCIRLGNISGVTNIGQTFTSCPNLTVIYAPEGTDYSGASATTMNAFGDNTNLRGGMGTEYSENYLNKTYARIDGGTSLPGYFTSYDE